MYGLWCLFSCPPKVGVVSSYIYMCRGHDCSERYVRPYVLVCLALRTSTPMEKVLGTKPYYQQGNAPAHKAHILKAFLSGIKFSSQSTSSMLGDPTCTTSLYPDLATTPGGPEAVRARMAEVLPVIWDSLGPEVFEPSGEVCLTRWVAAVIHSKGWYKCYKLSLLYYLVFTLQIFRSVASPISLLPPF